MPVYLKRLTLKNFKSFRSATIPFAKGFTAIMGPNGSGKSNIIDAILFVLGEGKLRHIRASRLKDLVFHGAKDGVAVVSLDLTDGNNEYTIVRMIDRKGRSIYKLNGKRVMRHEILSLLSSLGVSAEGYNIVLQGEITRLFNMNPVERRQIIDQVAGVAEYEERKQEAFKELEKVDAEIQDAELILAERKNVLKRLEAEKNAALEYMDLKKRLKGLRKAILEKRLRDTNNSLEHIRNQEEKARQELEDLQKKREELESKLSELEKKIASLDEQIRALVGSSAGALEAARLRYTTLEKELENAKKQKEQIIHQLSDLAIRRERLERELSALQAEVSDLRVRLREKRTSLDALSQRLNQLMNKLKQEEEEKSESKRRLLELEEELARLRKEFAEIKAEHGRLTGEYNAKLEQIQKDKERIAHVREKKRAAEEKLKEITKRLKEIEQRKRELLEREKRLNTEYLSISEEIKKLREKLGAYKGASAALRSLGVGVDVLESLLSAQREGKLFGIHGFVAQLIKYDERYTAAIEAAGGRRLFYIVVDTADAAAEAIKFLKRNNLGRATFAPLDRIRGTLTDVPKMDGVLGRLIDFVQFDARYRPVMEYVFGDTLLVRDIDVAKHLAGKYRAVTLAGDIVERSGVMSGGARQTTRILELFRAAELKKELNAREQEAKSILNELYRLREDVQRLSSEYSTLSAQAESLRSFVEEEEEFVGEDLSEIEQRIAELERRMGEIAKQISDLELERSRLLSTLKKSGAEDLEELDRLKREHDILSREVSELGTLLGKKEEKANNIRKEIKGILESESKLREEKDALDLEIGRLTSELEKVKKQMVALEAEYTEHKKRLTDLQEMRATLEQQRANVMLELSRVRDRIGEIEKDLAVWEERAKALLLEVEDLKRELSEYTDAESVPLPENPQEEIENIISRMRELEPINMRAIEEYEEQKKRIEEVEEKIEKLRRERAAVLELIDTLEKKKVNAFMQTFISISSLFSRIYKELAGGNATLKLTDEKNVFQAGLLIEAQPKGKPIKNMDAMSGGEKALVALAFLFAIAMYKPVGFYILDEPDLMLDKSNAEKMARFAKKLSKDNQFIIVSHRDVVLKEADQIIGVYMRGDGSSAIELLLSRSASGTSRQASSTS